MEWNYTAGKQDVHVIYSDDYDIASGTKDITLFFHTQRDAGKIKTERGIEKLTTDVLMSIHGKLSVQRNLYSSGVKYFCGVPNTEIARVDLIEVAFPAFGVLPIVTGKSTLEEMTPLCINTPGLDMAVRKGENKAFEYAVGAQGWDTILGALFNGYKTGTFSGQQTMQEILRKTAKREPLELAEVVKFLS
jgi:hypothetical protein